MLKVDMSSPPYYVFVQSVYAPLILNCFQAVLELLDLNHRKTAQVIFKGGYVDTSGVGP